MIIKKIKVNVFYLFILNIIYEYYPNYKTNIYKSIKCIKL